VDPATREYVSKLDTIQPTGKTLFIIFVDAPFTVGLPRLFTNKADVIGAIDSIVACVARATPINSLAT